MWILRTTNEGVDERVFRLLAGEPKTIGRATGADFIIDAALISRVHCRLTVLPDGALEVKDLDSTNGTFVNGSRITTAQVAPGDTLKVGRVEIVAMKEE
jgi:ABC transport system ATP-binding/permease protein